MVSEDYDGVDSPWNLSNAVQVNEPKNLIWTRVGWNAMSHGIQFPPRKAETQNSYILDDLRTVAPALACCDSVLVKQSH